MFESQHSVNRAFLLGCAAFLGQFVLMPAAALGAPEDQAHALFIQQLRQLDAAGRHHPEHGEIRLDKLEAFESLRSKFPLDRHLSIFVSDVETVSQIKFSEVMDKLAKDSGDKFLTKEVLFHQWWDSARQGPGLGLGPHCDDNTAPLPTAGIATHTAFSELNNLPYRCPRLEASEATSDPFTNETDSNPNAYRAIAFSNRFDLVTAPTPAASGHGKFAPDCGEHRVVFARNSGAIEGSNDLNRNLIIFEARVPNPHPNDGLKGCKPILEFWLSLSDKTMSAVERGRRLHDFYLKGLPGVGAVVDAAHYTFGAGQIRSNQFMSNVVPGGPLDWTLREFKTLKANGTMTIVPDSVKSNPGGVLFTSGTTDTRVGFLNQAIRASMESIIAGPANGVAAVNRIGFQMSGEGANSFESEEGPNTGSFADVAAAYAPGGMENAVLKANIQGALGIAGSDLTPRNVVNRIRTQTCSGCHHFSNGDAGLGDGAVWPDKSAGDGKTHPAMDFTQESEKFKDLQGAIVGGGKRYAISAAVECFLDFREEFMRRALGLPGGAGTGAARNNCPVEASK